MVDQWRWGGCGERPMRRGECSGDADLNDGKLTMLYNEYQEQLVKASKLGLDERSNPLFMEVDLNEMTTILTTDFSFLHSGNLFCLRCFYNVYYMYRCLYM